MHQVTELSTDSTAETLRDTFNRPEGWFLESRRLKQKVEELETELNRLRSIENESRDFLENAVEGIHKVGPDGTILWANHAELRLLGYTVDEYIGHNIMEFHADRKVITEILVRLRRGESLYNVPARLRCRDGSLKHVLIHSNVCFEQGEFRYTRCFTREVSQREGI